MNVPEVRYTRSGDVSIAYAVVGDGPFDIVFVSGWILSTLDVAWEGPAADFLGGVASFARVIVFDKRGTGLSDRAAGIPDLETRMDDIRAVMDAVGSNRAAIVGVSEGGPMSLLFAATYPERTAALIVYASGASNVRADDYPWAPSQDEWLDTLRQDAGKFGTPDWLDDYLAGFSPSIAHDEQAKRWWRRWVLSSSSPGALDALRRMNMGIDVRHTLSAIAVPTLILHPKDDDVHVLAEAEYMHDRIVGSELVVLPGKDHGWWVESDPKVREIQRFLQRIWDRGEWDVVQTERVLATVLFTDIVGSTARLAEVGDRAWRELVQQHHATVRRQLVRFSGREIDTAGDGFFASFDGPARAIRCACAIRDGVKDLGLDVRAGLHTGECEVVDGKVGGIAVHIGARVAANADGGEVLVSSTVKDLVAGSGIQFERRGVAELKGVPGEWALYSVTAA
ncbi:MAG: adenylate/guanylate cyclase domain-containing protein [Actinomycetota bacterium]